MQSISFRPLAFSFGMAVSALLMQPGVARAQGELIGQRGGVVSSTPTAPSGLLSGFNLGGQAVQSGFTGVAPATNLAGSGILPTLPSTLNLPAGVQSSLLKGLDASGTATRHGMGWIVSDAAHQGIHGQQLADVIHQLKPYKQRGVLTFPQNGQQPSFQQPFQRPFEGNGGRIPSFGRGHGHGKGR